MFWLTSEGILKQHQSIRLATGGSRTILSAYKFYMVKERANSRLIKDEADMKKHQHLCRIMSLTMS